MLVFMVVLVVYERKEKVRIRNFDCAKALCNEF